MSGRAQSFVLLAAMGVGLVACAGGTLPTTGIEAGGRGRYAAVAVAPLLADEVRLGSAQRAQAGWDTRDKAVRIAAEVLEPAGTRVTPIDVAGLPAGDARQLADGLRAAGKLPADGVVLALRQNAIDSRGRQYSPAMDFLSMGIIGLAVGAATHGAYFEPSFYLAAGDAFEEARCSIGFDSSLIDGRTGAVLGEARSIFGLEKIPGNFRPQNWAGMSDEERRTAETYCMAALRRGISQAIRALNLTAR